MSKESFYSVLGVPELADDAHIRRAYRKLALELHPDRNPDPAARDEWFRVSEAYEVLSSKERRSEYDRLLKVNAELRAERLRREQAKREAPSSRIQEPRAEPAPSPKQTHSTPKTEAIGQELLKLTQLMRVARYGEAERLANRLLTKAPREPVPYSVLGDIYKLRGDHRRSSEFYAYAAQMDAKNPVYQRKHEEALSLIKPSAPAAPMFREDDKVQQNGAPLVISTMVTLCCGAYLALSKENPVLTLPIVSTWTLGLMVMLIVSGLAIGVGLGVGGWLERSAGQITGGGLGSTPTMALGLLALFNFWIGAAIYFFIGLTQNALNPSTNRLIGAAAAATGFLAIAAQIQGQVSGLQTLFWGGNLIYLTAIMGWVLSDGLQESM